MRIFFLGNNRVGLEVLRWLRSEGDEIVGLAIHPPDRRKYGSEILETAGLPDERIFDGSKLEEPHVFEQIRACNADIGVSVLFDYILKPPLIESFNEGVVNLHPSYLPFNRGQYPNVWSIVEGTPSGVSLHYIDEGIDTGDLIARKKVPVVPTDTGASLYRKLERASVRLFKETWPFVRAGEAPRIEQDEEEGTYHRTRDVEKIDEIDLDRKYRAGDLIDILRARTFPPHPGAYFRDGDRKIYMRLELLGEEALRLDDEAPHGDRRQPPEAKMSEVDERGSEEGPGEADDSSGRNDGDAEDRG